MNIEMGLAGVGAVLGCALFLWVLLGPIGWLDDRFGMAVALAWPVFVVCVVAFFAGACGWVE